MIIERDGRQSRHGDEFTEVRCWWQPSDERTIDTDASYAHRVPKKTPIW